MTPHLLNYVTDLIAPSSSVTAPCGRTPLTLAQRDQIVPLMVDVALYGTAAGFFPRRTTWRQDRHAKSATARRTPTTG